MSKHSFEKDGSGMNRREFLKTAAAAAGAVGLAAAAPGVLWAAGEAKADAGGWRVLFDGKNLDAWRGGGATAGPPGKGWQIQEGALVRADKAGDIWTKERFGDFILDLEVKTKGNSGIFIRTDSIPGWLHSGIEIAIDKSFGKETMGKHDFGAVYDCLAPSKNALKGPDDWQHVVITCNDNKIGIVINDQQVIDMDLDQWPEAHKNPDGSKNKFNIAYKEMKREGHVGLQDHGGWVAYRNIKIKPLNPTPKKADGPTCPACGAKGEEGAYCAKCNTIITALGEYKCAMCGKTVKSGMYNEKTNKFLFNVNDDVKCPKCGKTKGTWCAGCGKYACLPSVTYCEKCKKPFDKIKNSDTCPKCGTKVEAAAK